MSEQETFPVSEFYLDSERCSDCGRCPVVSREPDNSIRWCEGCVDQAEWESAVMAEEHDECSLVRACGAADAQASDAPLRDWVEAWTGERP